jgi:hypothetical protein
VVLGLLLLEADRFDEAVVDLAEGARLRPEDVEAQLLAALAASVTDTDGLAYEMLERARIRVEDEDLSLVATVEERVDRGADAARAFLMDELGPDALRRRLQVRP